MTTISKLKQILFTLLIGLGLAIGGSSVAFADDKERDADDFDRYDHSTQTADWDEEDDDDDYEDDEW